MHGSILIFYTDYIQYIGCYKNYQKICLSAKQIEQKNAPTIEPATTALTTICLTFLYLKHAQEKY
jgi:hypothetical protein